MFRWFQTCVATCLSHRLILSNSLLVYGGGYSYASIEQYPRRCQKPSICPCHPCLIEATDPSTSTSQATFNSTLPSQYCFRIDSPKIHRPTRAIRDVRLEHPSSSVAADARPWTRRLCSLQESSLGHIATASSEALVIASTLFSCSSLLGPRPVQTLRGSTSGGICSSARHENRTRVKAALPQSLGGWVRMFRFNIAGLVFPLVGCKKC